MMPVDLWGESVTPRKWQAEALPIVQRELRQGGGPLLWACTGAGKSILQRAIVAWVLSSDKPGVIVVDVPTQNLVKQMSATLEAHPWLAGRVGVFYGNKKKVIDRGVIVCCRPSLRHLVSVIVANRWPVRLYMVDEAHIAPDRQREFIGRLVDEELGPGRKIAVTATPYRSDIKDSLTLWDRVVVEYNLNDATRDGVLVPYEHKTWDGPSSVDIDDACAQMLREHAHHGPMLANAVDIEDAKSFASRLREAGLSADYICGRHSAKRREALASRLRDGDLDCLVHVATLVEGVDWPWLRVLCLRRQAMTRYKALAEGVSDSGGSRVRLVQEIGRALRVHPGKDCAYILDPAGVCGFVGLAHSESIGERETEPGAAPPGEPRGPREDSQREACFTISTDRVLSWVSQAHQFAVFAGHIEKPRGYAWRSSEPSEKQLVLLQRIADQGKVCLPEPMPRMVLAAAEALLAHPNIATKGAVSDVIGLVFAGRDAFFNAKNKTGQWPVDDSWWRAMIPSLDEPQEDRSAS